MTGEPRPSALPWQHFPALYSRLAPPLRPAPGDAQAIATAIAGRDSRVLMLGVTPGLAAIGQDLTAVDRNPAMLSDIWPGDRNDRRAQLENWTALSFADASFTAVIGDGSLNCAADGIPRLVDEIARVIEPDGIAVFRTFVAPDTPESLEAIAAAARGGEAGNVHALKWRIGMALAAEREDFTVAAPTILEHFNRLFPDRDALAAATGWGLSDIATLDAYVGASHVLAFPTRQTLEQLGARRFASTRFSESAGYPLAERCPLVVWSGPAAP